MRTRELALALGFLLSASPAFAADQSVDLSGGSASFVGTSPLLDGGDDVITFTNLAPGLYNFLLSLSAQNVVDLEAELNGEPADLFEVGPLTFAGLVGVDDAPFVLTITGTPNGLALYSGELQVTLVPEPGTLALLLAGLGLITRAARRS
jgi:hypothetical protein